MRRAIAEDESSDLASALQAWRAKSLEGLVEKGGPVCRHAAQYILKNDIKIGFARQSTGARWTFKGNIELNRDHHTLESNPANPLLLGAIVHEATHLEQGTALALSVEGEVGGWKAEYDARTELDAPITNSHWAAVARVPGSPTDHDLAQARHEMLQMAGYRYLVWLLPLRPNLWTRLAESLQRILLRSSQASE